MNIQLKPTSFWLLPGRCVVCDKRSKQKRDLCESCDTNLPHNNNCCARCALPLAISAPLCGVCSQQQLPFTRALGAFSYEGDIPKLMQGFKFGKQLACGRVMSESLTELVIAEYQTDELPNLLLPVPLHWRRLLQRGFNQSYEVSRVLSKQLKIPIAKSAIKRTKYAPSQSSLKRKERLKNLAGAYTVTMPSIIKNQHIAVIDDVMTTGATAITMAELLQSAGASRVDIWSLARTPNK